MERKLCFGADDIQMETKNKKELTMKTFQAKGTMCTFRKWLLTFLYSTLLYL